MSLVEALILGLVQGLTEFIPVSSSGHLVIVPWLLSWPEPGLAFDTMVHLGTLVAVLAFFARDYVALVAAWARSLPSRKIADDRTRLAWLLIVATIPAALAGFFLEEYFEQMFTAPALVGVFLVVTAGLLFLAERLGRQHRDLESLGVWMAVFIGLAQALAIAPGVSRSGATIAAGLGLGLTRPVAARFSFMLSGPIIFGAAASQMMPLLRGGLPGSQFGVVLVGFAMAAVVGYVCIGFMLRYLQGRGLQVFASYCLVVGVATVLLAVVP